MWASLASQNSLEYCNWLKASQVTLLFSSLALYYSSKESELWVVSLLCTCYNGKSNLFYVAGLLAFPLSLTEELVSELCHLIAQFFLEFWSLRATSWIFSQQVVLLLVCAESSFPLVIASDEVIDLESLCLDQWIKFHEVVTFVSKLSVSLRCGFFIFCS